MNALVKKIGVTNARGILDGTVEFTVTARTREFLTPAGEVTLPATDGVDPGELYKTREGLYVWREFRDWIVSAAEPTALPEATLASFDLAKPANDAEIQSELSEDHVFEASEFCGYLASLIAHQPNGEEGNLLTNSYANIFYVRGRKGEVHAVDVRWYDADREWDVYASPLDDVRWREGYRVLSGNC